MLETCLKCGHVNNASTGDDAEACLQCGAIYSKVEAAMAAKRKAPVKERGPQFWTYAVLIGLLTVLVPLTVYEHTWGSSAKRKKSEASLNLALAAQRIQEQETAAKAKRDTMDLAISQGRVLTGMTAEQVQAAWGRPTNVNRTVSARATTEQWVYRRSAAKTNYVHLDDGVVRSFQVSE